jgi:signal transduction histidine kinase
MTGSQAGNVKSRIARLTWILAAFGLSIGLAILVVVYHTLTHIREDRVRVEATQVRLSTAMGALRSEREGSFHQLRDHLANDHEHDAQSCRIPGELPALLGEASDAYNRFNAIAATKSDAMVPLQKSLAAFFELHDRIVKWKATTQQTRLAWARAWEDTQHAIHNALTESDRLSGRTRLQRLSLIRQYRAAPTDNVEKLAETIIKGFGDDAYITTMNTELADLAILCEHLRNEENVDILVSLKDNDMRQALGRLRMAVNGAPERSRVALLAQVRSIENALFGSDARDDSGHQTLIVGDDGFYSLHRELLNEIAEGRSLLRAVDRDLIACIEAERVLSDDVAELFASAAVRTEARMRTAGLDAVLLGGVLAAGFLILTVRIASSVRRVEQDLRASNARLIEALGREKDMSARLEETMDELSSAQRGLIESSHRAGMAEVATGVLHNVGNVLNSVNISASIAMDKVREMSSSKLAKAVALMEEHKSDLATFISEDDRGSQLPGYFAAISSCLANEQDDLLNELDALATNIDHIKTIVGMQQSHAGVAGVAQTTTLGEMIDDVLRLEIASFVRHNIRIVREYDANVQVSIQKQKVFQILINLVVNAKQAMRDSGEKGEHVLIVRAACADDGTLRFEFRDTGPGIAPENLTKIFSHGFTTKRDGHGFGLHHAALSATEMGGNLTVESDGLGQGAAFILTLPVEKGAHKERVAQQY